MFERNDHVGGLALRYTDERGLIGEHGGHVMFSHYSCFDDLVEKTLRGDYDHAGPGVSALRYSLAAPAIRDI